MTQVMTDTDRLGTTGRQPTQQPNSPAEPGQADQTDGQVEAG